MPWFLDLRAWGQGGPLAPVKLSDGVNFRDTPGGYLQFLSEIRGREVVLATHGFENNRQQGTASLKEWASHLQLTVEPVFVGILWPGDGVLHFAVDYIWEGQEADSAGAEVGAFIDEHFAVANSLSFASHSLGARVVLQAIRNIRAIPRIRRLLLMAGAIEDDTLVNEFADAAAKVDQIDIMYSYEDWVLQKCYPGGNLVGRLLEWSTPNLKNAIGRSGCRPPSPGMLRYNYQMPPGWNWTHSDYLTGTAVSGDYRVPVQPLPALAAPAFGDIFTPQGYWKPCFSAALASTFWR